MLLIISITGLAICIPLFVSIMNKIHSIGKEYEGAMYSQRVVPARFTKKIRKTYYNGVHGYDYGYEYHGQYAYVWNGQTRYFEVTNSNDTFSDVIQINVHPVTGYTQDSLDRARKPKIYLAIFLMIIIIILSFALIGGILDCFVDLDSFSSVNVTY